MIHQHFMLVPTLTVAENVALGLEIVPRTAPGSGEGHAHGLTSFRSSTA